MFKFLFLQLICLISFTTTALVAGALIAENTKSDGLGIAIWLLLQIIIFIYLTLTIIKRIKNKHPQTPTAQFNKNIASSSESKHNVPLNKEIVIEYSSSKGDITTRKILVHELEYVTKKNKMIPRSLSAYCFVRKAPRNFIIDRILSAYDANTGEIIDDLPNYLTNKS